MSKVTFTHDHFIRNILADKAIAADYFQNYLPPFVSSQLDFSTLTQMQDTYLSEKLQKSMSDIVYSCSRKGSRSKVKVALLIEHKSYPDKYTPVQIGGYIFSGLQKQLDNKETLSPIIPILLYHGKGKWQYQTLTGLFENLTQEWEKFIPNFDYVYNNLGEIPDEAVETLSNKFLVASLLALKHGKEKKWLEDNAGRVLTLIEEASENLQKGFLVYLLGNGHLDENQIRSLFYLLSSNLQETVMSTLDIFEKKGKKIGMAIGREEASVQKNITFTESLLRETKFDTAQIARLVGVTVDFVEKIRSQLK